MECNLAGRQYYDADEVWEDIKVGTMLELERETGNLYDPNAVMVCLSKRTGREHVERYKLGYIPAAKNEAIAQLLDMGWNDVLECRISKFTPDAPHYEQQVRLTVWIKRNKNTRRPNE